MPRYIDLSAPITASPPELPDALRTDLSRQDHAAGAAQIAALTGVGVELLRDGEGWATETFTTLSTHGTTHVDAPWHYNSQIGGERAQTIDELPLEWFMAPGVVLPFMHKADGDAITAEEVDEALEAVGHDLQPLDIVLVHTGRDEFYDDPGYMALGCGVSQEATLALHGRGVRVMGIDAWGWDAPLHLQAEAAKAAGAPGIFWSAHQAGVAYCQIERLCNLGALPATGFTVACFPLRVTGGSAGPTRAVAIVPG